MNIHCYCLYSRWKEEKQLLLFLLSVWKSCTYLKWDGLAYKTKLLVHNKENWQYYSSVFKYNIVVDIWQMLRTQFYQMNFLMHLYSESFSLKLLKTCRSSRKRVLGNNWCLSLIRWSFGHFDEIIILNNK